MKDLRKRANLEEEEHGDLVFVPVVDSNETDSDNFKHLSIHSMENFEFSNLLLVNDETFVFLEKLTFKSNIFL